MINHYEFEPDRWVARWREALEAATRLGGDAKPLQVKPPATHAAVEAVEARIGFALPDEFKRVLREFAEEVEFYWFLPEGHPLPEPFHDTFGGGCSWSLRRLPEIQESLNAWISEVFPNPERPYDRVWHEKLGFMEVGNGDIVALDLGRSNSGAVVYLSHDGGEGHGYVLGKDFCDFIGRWSELGCPGGEDWQWLPFTSNSDGLLDPTGPRAETWRGIFGMSE